MEGGVVCGWCEWGVGGGGVLLGGSEIGGLEGLGGVYVSGGELFCDCVGFGLGFIGGL